MSYYGMRRSSSYEGVKVIQKKRKGSEMSARTPFYSGHYSGHKVTKMMVWKCLDSAPIHYCM